MKLHATAVASSLLGSASAMEILLMGDWGGQSTTPYYTVDEKNTATSMKEQWDKYKVPLILALGDNFYDAGVKNENDKRFQETFEKVFDPSLDRFQVLAGNHDYAGNVTGEIEYSSHSTRWNFPSLYYTFTEELDSGSTLQFVFLDSCTLAGVPSHSENCEEENCRDELSGSKLDGSTVPDQQAADDQWSWAQATLANSTANFLVVAAHYPVWSVGEHGPTAALVNQLKPMLEQYKATAYFSGHDHSGQHIQDPADPAQVDYHVVGAAHNVDSSTAHASSVPKNSLKFHDGSGLTGGMYARISANSTSFVVHHYANDGKLLYSSPPKKPRR